MDKWEKVVTLKRKLTDLKHGLTLEELQEFLECDRATVYRIKDLAGMLFGIDIIKDKQTKKFRFDFKNSELIMDILKWGDSAEVVAPKSLREEIRGNVERMSGKYDGSA
jgi:predicted DNA-binding transcriptional regulator YafY